MQSTHALTVALRAGDKSYMQYCQYKESCRLQLHVSRHLNPFHPAYMHKKWCRKIDANRQWHGAPPPTLRFPPGPPLKPGLQHRRTTRKRQQPHMHFHPPRLHTSPPQPKSRPALKLDNVRLLKNFVSFTLTTAMNNVVARTLRRTALQ